MDMNTVKVLAQQGDALFQKFMEVEPTISTIASVIVPGAAPVVALVQPELLVLAPVIEKALEDLAAGNNGNAASGVLQLIMHLTKGLPNAPALSPEVNGSGN